MLDLGQPFLDGKYQIESKLGHGSFGIVYKALEQFSKKHVAIKEITDDDYKEALLSEIELMAGLHHANVVQYKTTEKLKENLYLVMEYLPGGSLVSLIGEGKKISSGLAKQHLIDILEGLKYLHSFDVVHRDLKPDNVLLAADGHVKIADFGVSRAISKSRKASSRAGTIKYMAPEMFEADEEHGYDHRVDLYAAGCLYFEMLVGTPPFTGTDTKVMMGHVAHDPAYPASLSEEELAVLQGLLAKDAKDRFSNAEAVLLALAGEIAPVVDGDRDEDIYRQAAVKALADGVIDDAERSLLNSLKGSLGLSRETCDE
ncbi:serine/threonine-protein kinase, partial [Mariprofundus sp. EBB-1]|uniref:serine/threonine-protein kinase n=1 Tax=Mariprofundus sp. EBB-1 TaxID=2650971 RepID=UPI000F2C9947